MMKLVVLSCLLAAASASALAPFAPFAYSAAYYAPYNYNYRGPLSLAPGQPANILGADGRPLDTLDVNLDRSAHLTAKAFANSGFHILKKRSAPVIAAPVISAPISRIAYAAPLAYSAHIAAPYAAPISYGYSHAYSAPIYHY